MLDHTIEQIEQTEAYFRKEKFPVVVSDAAGRDLKYHIIPQSLNPDLPDFIYRVTNDKTKRNVMGVSQSVPKELQPYFILAEYIEFIEIGLGARGRIKEAERRTLNVIPTDLLKDYLERKVKLYETELELDVKEPEKYALGQEGRSEFENAVAFLHEQLKKLNAPIGI